jgi:hypothetical protein
MDRPSHDAAVAVKDARKPANVAPVLATPRYHVAMFLLGTHAVATAAAGTDPGGWSAL